MVGSKRSLVESDYQRVVGQVMAWLRQEPSIRNCQFRALTGMSYDQAIWVLGRMVSEGKLERVGAGGGRKYVRASPPSAG